MPEPGRPFGPCLEIDAINLVESHTIHGLFAAGNSPGQRAHRACCTATWAATIFSGRMAASAL